MLRPRGGLAILWTHWWETKPPLPEEALELLREPWLRSQPQRRPPWRGAFDGSPFEPLQVEEAQTRSRSTPEELLTLYSTTSALALFPRTSARRSSPCAAAARGAVRAAAQTRAHLDEARMSSSSESGGGTCV